MTNDKREIKEKGTQKSREDQESQATHDNDNDSKVTTQKTSTTKKSVKFKALDELVKITEHEINNRFTTITKKASRMAEDILRPTLETQTDWQPKTQESCFQLIEDAKICCENQLQEIFGLKKIIDSTLTEKLTKNHISQLNTLKNFLDELHKKYEEIINNCHTALAAFNSLDVDTYIKGVAPNEFLKQEDDSPESEGTNNDAPPKAYDTKLKQLQEDAKNITINTTVSNVNLGNTAGKIGGITPSSDDILDRIQENKKKFLKSNKALLTTVALAIVAGVAMALPPIGTGIAIAAGVACLCIMAFKGIHKLRTGKDFISNKQYVTTDANKADDLGIMRRKLSPAEKPIESVSNRASLFKKKQKLPHNQKKKQPQTIQKQNQKLIKYNPSTLNFALPISGSNKV